MTGNGKHTFTIDVAPVGPGYVIVAPRAGQGEPPDATPFLLSCSLRDWLAERPSFRVRASVPIVQHGQTVAIHLWYDEQHAPPA